MTDGPIDHDRTRPLHETSPDFDDVTCALALWEGGYRRLPLVEPGVVNVGRAEECELRIDHASVSRQHLRLHVGERLAVEDLGSFNGTRLNGAQLTANVPQPFGAGDVVEIGRALLTIQPGTKAVGGRRAEAPIDGREAMERLDRLVDLVAKSKINVVLLGETGVGKEVTAEAIHARSPRVDARFVQINCAAVPEQLLEAELFGFERAAFTGADRAKPGLMEAAHGGTFFLDEVAELPLATQAKLLRVIERREVQRLGALTPKTIDVRFVAATNRDLRALTDQGKFRSDLYFRLNGITLAIPPLRQRTHQIAELAHKFAALAASELGRSSPSISAEALRALEASAWPGNVRELKNVIERAVLFSSGAAISTEHLELDVSHSPMPPSAPASSALGRNSLRKDYESFERDKILAALDQVGGNQTEAAKLLGISRRTLINRLEALNLPRPRKRRV